jgi:uncharacterized protein (TIGR03067 family)
MRRAIGLTFLAAMAMPVWADDKAGGDDKLIGTWGVVSIAHPRGKDDVAEGEVSITLAKDGKGISREKGMDEIELTWWADTSLSPHTLDMTAAWLGDKPTTRKAIYRIDGDQLEIAFTRGDRPKEFDPKYAAVLTLKRQKP